MFLRFLAEHCGFKGRHNAMSGQRACDSGEEVDRSSPSHEIMHESTEQSLSSIRKKTKWNPPAHTQALLCLRAYMGCVQFQHYLQLDRADTKTHSMCGKQSTESIKHRSLRLRLKSFCRATLVGQRPQNMKAPLAHSHVLPPLTEAFHKHSGPSPPHRSQSPRTGS